MQLGQVYLVGAGIGSQEYLTIKGKQRLSVADIVIYDALIDQSLLDLAPSDSLKICVGKRGGQPSTPQARINQLLVAYCLEGKQVIRLKSGDPLIFGRANEEIAALQQAKCNFELIPGISSALAAPLLAGIPLTDKHLSSCFAVVSGHQPEQLNWSALAKIDTVVILMGGRCLAEIIQNLLVNGRSPCEPIAIIHNCGRPQQQFFWGTLTDIVEKTIKVSLSPAVIIIGKVVKLSKQDFYTAKSAYPLSDQTILVTRALDQASKFTNLLEAKGAKVIEMPALAITPPSSWADLDQAIANIRQFQWLILTSANAVDYFFERLYNLGYDLRILGNIKIAVVGRKTAEVLKQRGLNCDFYPPDYIADSLVANFPENLSGKNILFPRVETGGRELLVAELTKGGAKVVEVAAYQSRCPDAIEPTAWQALQQQQVNIITFASSKTVRNFYQLLKQQLSSDNAIKSLLANVNIASIGPQTSQTCCELLGRIDIEAKEYTLEGLTQAIALE
ncbi:uroporphyrin-III C-methyltransferase [Chondrocystis sp. NIES-4102]|nr:uroporphyrin-III C-methyltransferase [Chondrocystis sp. NIES-4102]